jgi:hypothetical protein
VRVTLLSGAVLTVASILVIVLSSSLGLDVESVALMGAGSGAVIALVPGNSPQTRLLGFLAGFAISWLGYLVRAGFLPDTTAGHAIAVAVVVALCTVVAAASREHLPLWTLLLGAAVLAGSYETTYIEAPSQVLRTSASSSTSVLLAFAFGFFAAALVAPFATGSNDVPAEAPEAPTSPANTAETAEPAKTSKTSKAAAAERVDDDSKLGEMLKGDAR